MNKTRLACLAAWVVAGFAFADRADALSAGSYVQDGLVAQFDAIENVGFGVHDGNAAVWQDLKGEAQIAVASGNGWGTRSLATLTTGTAAGRTITGLPVLLPYSMTVEASVSISSIANTGWPYVFHESSGNFSVITYNTDDVLLQINKINTGGDSRPSFGYFRTGTLAAASDSTNYRLVIDGTDKKTSGSGKIPASSSPLQQNWVFGGNNGGPIYGDYRSLRFYNRGLSDDELAFNAMIDGLRFFSYSLEGNDTETAIPWANVTWMLPKSGAAAAPSADLSDYVRISGARVAVAATDAVALKGVSLEKNAILELASDVEARVRVMYVNGVKVEHGIYTATGAGGTQQVNWLAGEGQLAVGGDLTAAIPTTMAATSGDGWFEFGMTEAEGGAAGFGAGCPGVEQNREWVVGERPDWRGEVVYPVGSKLRLKGYVLLDKVPSGIFSEIDTSALKYIELLDDEVFDAETMLVIPSGATVRFQAGTWENHSGTNWLVSAVGAKTVFKGNIQNNGTIKMNANAACVSRPTFAGSVSGTGDMVFSSYDNQVRFTGPWNFSGDIKGFNQACAIWIDTKEVSGVIDEMTFMRTDQNSPNADYCANGLIFGAQGRDEKADNALNINTLYGRGGEVVDGNGKRWRTGGHIVVWGSNTVNIAGKLHEGVHVVANRDEYMSKRYLFDQVDGRGIGFLRVNEMAPGTIYASTNVNIWVNWLEYSCHFDYTFQTDGVNGSTLETEHSNNGNTLKATTLTMLPARVRGFLGHVDLTETETKNYAIPMDFTPGPDGLYTTAGCNGSGILRNVPASGAIDVTFEENGAAKSGAYAVARFTSGGSKLNGWTVTLNGEAVTSSSLGSNLVATLKRDDTGIWLDVRKTGFAIILR